MNTTHLASHVVLPKFALQTTMILFIKIYQKKFN
jgi:hypothetical protein